MRAYDGQLSDNRPIRRTLEEKKRQLGQLKAALSQLKPHTAPALRTSIEAQIATLEQDIAAAHARSSGTARPGGSPRSGPPASGSSQNPRRIRRDPPRSPQG